MMGLRVAKQKKMGNSDKAAFLGCSRAPQATHMEIVVKSAILAESLLEFFFRYCAAGFEDTSCTIWLQLYRNEF